MSLVALNFMSDTPTPQRIGHGLVREDVLDPVDARGKSTISVFRDRRTVPLDSYLDRGVVTDRQHRAGQSLAASWRRAVGAGRVAAMRWGSERVDGGGYTAPPPPGAADLWKLLVASDLADQGVPDEPCTITQLPDGRLAAMRGPVRLNAIGLVTVAVVCFDEWAGGTRRLAKLREGLDRLVAAMRL